ncbi:MAG TPA: cupin domain-containing protein [Candidatus Limnocylindrales bacterium]|nr:cupin domain-containing protein [Candidatus Limnocylindrales bacterium]
MISVTPQKTSTPTDDNRALKRHGRIRSVAAAGAAAMALVAVAVTIASASPASGVTPTLLARSTYDSFKVMSYPDSGGLFKAEAKQPIDVVVRRHDYAVGGSTGWHAHPYPVFITVISGELTFYEYDDPTCTPIVVSAGEGYVDSGNGHIGRNETDQPAADISVIMAPVGAPFRAELETPGPYCGF